MRATKRPALRQAEKNATGPMRGSKQSLYMEAGNDPDDQTHNRHDRPRNRHGNRDRGLIKPRGPWRAASRLTAGSPNRGEPLLALFVPDRSQLITPTNGPCNRQPVTTPKLFQGP
jgi:hypothetical protein